MAVNRIWQDWDDKWRQIQEGINVAKSARAVLATEIAINDVCHNMQAIDLVEHNGTWMTKEDRRRVSAKKYDQT